jgi:hypothetical protein
MSRTQHPIDLIEEAIHLLRRAPIETYAFFLIGIAPFVLCFFRFCSEMSYSELAATDLPGFALTLALSYLWMKAMQYLACRQLLRVYTGELPNQGNLVRILRSCVHQATIHPLGLLAKPMAAVASIPGFITFVPPLMLPASITFSFFQNASVLITGEPGEFEKCWRLSVNRGRATVSLLLLTLFLRIVVFLNVYLTIGVLPYLLKALFGIDTFLSRDFRWLISFAYFVGVGLISYFVVDLLIKAIQVIQVCRAEAQTTGKDLQRSLLSLTVATGRRTANPTKRNGWPRTYARSASDIGSRGLLLLCLLIPALTPRAEAHRSQLGQPPRGCHTESVRFVRHVGLPETTQRSPFPDQLSTDVPFVPLVPFVPFAPSVPSARSIPHGSPSLILASVKRITPQSDADRIPESELNEHIDRELSGSEYSWRKPQSHLISPENNWLQNSVVWITKTLGKIFRGINQIADALTKWWKSLFPDSANPMPLSAGTSAPNWITQVLLWAILVGFLVATALIILRIIGRTKKKAPAPIGPQISIVPNLKSETIVADDLPEDQWILLARRKLEEGEPRLALRALFLAALSLLGSQRLIIVRQSKSNADYEAELKRRRSAELTELFKGDRRLFERCWYGDHPVTDLEIEQSNHFYQRLKHACLAEK